MKPERSQPSDPSCPTEAELSAFSLGQLSVPRLEAVAEHLNDCPTCSSQLHDSEEKTNAALSGLRTVLIVEPDLQEPECELLAARARALGRGEERQAAILPAAAHDLPCLGNYQLLEEIGQGGMGTVYRALHSVLHKVFALKLLKNGQLAEPAALARFQQEIKAMGALDHPNLIRATDAGESAGTPFLVMEYVEGMDLGRILRLLGPLAIADACEVVRQAALGLQHAHERGLVHRDIKPSNLMLTSKGQVKVLDMGLALLRAKHFSGEELTSPGQVMGTAQFVAPEQVISAHDVDIRADLYSLGCTLFKLLTGELPHSRPFLAQAVTEAPAAQLLKHRPDTPVSVQAVVDCLLAWNPDLRYKTPAELVQQLQPLVPGNDLRRVIAMAHGTARVQGEYVPISPSGLDKTGPYPPESQELHEAALARPTAPSRRFRHRRLWALGLVVVSLATACSVALSLMKTPEPGPQAQPAPPDPNLVVLPPTELSELSHPTATTRWHYDPQRKEIWVSTNAAAYLRLGKPTSSSYRLAFTIDRVVNDPFGQVGAFLGYVEQKPPLKGKKYHLVALVTLPGKREAVYQMQHSELVLFTQRGNMTFREVNVPTPPLQEHHLEIVVRAGKLHRVRWNEEELPGLIDPPGTRPVPAPFDKSLEGAVGIYCFSSSVLIRDMVLTNEKDE